VSTTPPLELMLSEMTEQQREAVESGVRQRLIERAFGHDRASSPPLSANALSRAVVSAVTELGRERVPSLTRRLFALLDLVELERLHVPFDAQTRFYESFLAGHSTGDLDSELAAIAVRLGFAVARIA